jgi:subtilisin family serine protease
MQFSNRTLMVSNIERRVEEMLRYKSIITTLAILIVLVMVSGIKVWGFELPEVVNGRYLIMMNAEQGIPADLHDAVSEAGGELVSTVPEIGMAVATSEADDFADNLAKHEDVNCVIPELNVKWIPDKEEMYVQQVTPDEEPLYGFQWNMQVIDAPDAWSAGYAGRGARVADLDTGITPGHPDLAPNIDLAASKSFVPFEPTIDDLHMHGTWTAGIIAAADNGFGISGVAPEATIIAVKVLSGEGRGYFEWVIEGIVYAATEADADIINMSLVGYIPKSDMHDEWWPAQYSDYYVSLMNRALNYAEQRGVTVVSAAGNYATNLNYDRYWVVLPAEAGNGMAVFATGPLSQNDFDTPAFYTNYGASVIDVAAPGGNIDFMLYLNPLWWLDMVLSTAPPPFDFIWGYGTSASASHVSGVAALVIGQHNGELSPAQVKAIIEQSADNLSMFGTDDDYGCGRVNAYKSVAGISQTPAINRGRVSPAGKLAASWGKLKVSR